MKNAILIWAAFGFLVIQKTTAQRLLPAPTNVSAAATHYDVTLTWTDNSGELETAFEIYRDGGLQNNYQLVGTVGRDETSFRDQKVSPNSLYYYRVRAVNSRQISDFSRDIEVKTPVAPPNTPGELQAASSGNLVQLKWNGNNDGGTLFYVERAEGDSQDFRRIASVPYSRTLTYDDRDVSPARKYCYRIQAHNESGDSRYSNTACAETAELKPSIPARLTATPVSNAQINLSWADVSANETGFELQWSKDGNAFTKLADLGENVTEYEHKNLANKTKYYYRIKAKGRVGDSDFSAVAEATTFDVPPGKPADLSAETLSSSQVKLSWKDQANNEAGFDIEQSEDGNTFHKVGDAGENATSFEVNGLNPATKYWFRVRSRNASGISEPSNVAEATTRDVAPQAPARLNAVAVTFERIDLTWEDLSGNETGFLLEYATNGTSFSKLADLKPDVKSYQASGLKSETKYYFRIQAFNAIGASAFSNVAEATTPKAPVPDAPQNLTAVPMDFDLVQLKWSRVSANATQVVIERSKSKDSGYKEIGRVPATATELADREILDVADYYYRIKAINNAGSSGYSNVAVVFAASIITGVEPARKADFYAFDRKLFVSTEKHEPANITLYNVRGSVVKQFKNTGSSTFDLQNLPAGIYIVKIEQGQIVAREKVVVY